MYQKTAKIEIRLTDDEKKKIKIYAATKGVTMSDAIRSLCETIFKGEANND